MRVYLTGAHSSGKTTLARYISEHYNLPILPEVARIILAEKELQLDTLRTNLDVVDSYQTDIFNRQIIEEKKYAAFVSDRSLIDCLAYTASHSRVAHQLVSEPSFKDYVELFKQSIVFFVRPSKATLRNDGVREQLSWDGVVSIDAQIKLLLELFAIRHFHINTDNMQERIRQIDNTLSLVKA